MLKTVMQGIHYTLCLVLAINIGLKNFYYLPNLIRDKTIIISQSEYQTYCLRYHWPKA